MRFTLDLAINDRRRQPLQIWQYTACTAPLLQGANAFLWSAAREGFALPPVE
jgi:hypothetical protein